MQVAEFSTEAQGDIVPISGYDPYLKRDYSHFAYVPHPLPYEPMLELSTHKAAADAALAIGLALLSTADPVCRNVAPTDAHLFG